MKQDIDDEFLSLEEIAQMLEITLEHARYLRWEAGKRLPGGQWVVTWDEILKFQETRQGKFIIKQYQAGTLLRNSPKEGLMNWTQKARMMRARSQCETVAEINQLIAKINRTREQNKKRVNKLAGTRLVSDLKRIHEELLSMSGEDGLLDDVDSKRAIKIAGYLHKVIENIENGSL
jgi:hypothetical protein